jgi:UDP-N-acetylmuramoyl-L-alanyl-D-glutamate--2,6-diaminopimelate ligase
MCAGRLIVVFGCGGNRDHGKRPLMGAIAEANADRVIVTSDNPRNEDPHRIIDDIFQGISNTAGHCSQEVDREIAIASAISEAERDDIVVIAGKGHEPTQDIAGVLHPFLDADVARKYVAQREETTK